jgi:hypothetical protein
VNEAILCVDGSPMRSIMTHQAVLGAKPKKPTLVLQHGVNRELIETPFGISDVRVS